MNTTGERVNLLAAPCRWCGYNGAGYYQAGTHAVTCPWFNVGGKAAREDTLAQTVCPVSAQVSGVEITPELLVALDEGTAALPTLFTVQRVAVVRALVARIRELESERDKAEAYRDGSILSLADQEMRKYRFPDEHEFLNEFVVPKGHCSLCGNSGVIDTRGVRTAAGVEVGGRFFCLCPYGREWKAQTVPVLTRTPPSV